MFNFDKFAKVIGLSDPVPFRVVPRKGIEIVPVGEWEELPDEQYPRRGGTDWVPQRRPVVLRRRLDGALCPAWEYLFWHGSANSGQAYLTFRPRASGL
jgi:hypothetical protein